MKVLLACEISGVVRDALLAKGHDAVSCDLLPSERPGPHIQDDVRNWLINHAWDMMIAFPPCTYLAVSGARWFNTSEDRVKAQDLAVNFFLELACAPIDRIAIENPIGIMSTRWRKPDQIVQPWQFGEDASKATCLWLKNLTLLVPTKILPGGRLARRANQTPSGQNKLGPSPQRAIERAKTYQGIAEAMAEQWGENLHPKTR